MTTHPNRFDSSRESTTYQNQLTGVGITCAGGETTPIGKSPMVTGVTPAWKEFEFLFTVPEAGCRAQQLLLQLAARSASEQLVSGSLWYDELSISRTAEGNDPT
jgi:hypothetical protein